MTAWAAVAACAVIAADAADPTIGEPAGPVTGRGGEVAVFYYPWYGTPARDGTWQHWQQNGNTPPVMIGSGWYPARGPYSSSDAAVVRAQMQEIASVGVQTVIVSWWGEGSAEGARLPLVASAARGAGLRVALHVEPFAGRTPETLLPQIRSLASSGITDVYVYDSTTSPDSEWRSLNEKVPGLRLFANTSLPGRAKAGGFAGLYTYDVRVNNGSAFPRVCASARKLGLVCAPSVGPGFDASRATGETRIRSRRNGATYDHMWQAAIRAAADVVTVTSYNEWHEGTQIEPARAAGPSYASYEGAYGLAGRAAERAYLDRTARWARTYHARMAR
jgi:hypothetical protein